MSVVWTGPTSTRSSGRLTIGVIADLIAEAVREIVLVSYATVPSLPIREALQRAQESGVELILLLESPEENAAFTGRKLPFPGLQARRLHWPSSSRAPGASMHAKVLVVDRQVALVGSANLTGYGLERNLECGVLIRGGELPARIAQHFLSVPELTERE